MSLSLTQTFNRMLLPGQRGWGTGVWGGASFLFFFLHSCSVLPQNNVGLSYFTLECKRIIQEKGKILFIYCVDFSHRARSIYADGVFHGNLQFLTGLPALCSLALWENVSLLKSILWLSTHIFRNTLGVLNSTYFIFWVTTSKRCT